MNVDMTNDKSILCSFSKIYREEIYKPDAHIFLNFEDIKGTFGYCSDEAALEIKKQTEKYAPAGVRFLDNGNYHYISKLMIEKIEHDFELVVFDNHTDAQPPCLAPILSCGSWIRDSLNDKSIALRKVYLIGPKKEDYKKIDEQLKERIVFIDREDALCPEKSFRDIADQIGKLPLYISIDKDILSKDEIRTNWDQGLMRFNTLCDWIKLIKDRSDVIGADICGEPGINESKAQKIKSALINIKLEKLFYKK